MIRKNDPIDKHIGARIRMRRKQIGVAQQALAEHLGLTFQQVQKYEKGANRVGGSTMARIAEKLSVDVGFFYHGLPGAGPSQVREPIDTTMDEFMGSREGLIIAEAFVAIPDPKVRSVIAGAIRDLGHALTPKPHTIMSAG